ncbi:MAG: DUF3540 domain-containing protein [Syntrophales bacterium]
MNNIIPLKRLEQPREAAFLFALVEGKDGETNGYRVRLDSGELLAAPRAGGCLLAPETGDEVLIADNGDRAFILTVLAREGDRGTITLPEISAVEGGDITFTARRAVAMEAPRITLAGILGEVKFKGISLLSQWCDVRISKITTVAERWDRIVGRLSERIRDSYRRIENTEQTMAGRIRTIVKGRFSLSSKNAAVTAEEEVKVDGKKIHLG